MISGVIYQQHFSTLVTSGNQDDSSLSWQQSWCQVEKCSCVVVLFSPLQTHVGRRQIGDGGWLCGIGDPAFDFDN